MPQLDGTGEIHIESADRASGHFTTREDRIPSVISRTIGDYWRADQTEVDIADGPDYRKRAKLIAERLARWKSARRA